MPQDKEASIFRGWMGFGELRFCAGFFIMPSPLILREAILELFCSGDLTAIGSKRDWKNGRFSVLNYYKKRIKRIYPQLLIMVFAAAGVMAIAMPKLLDGIRGEIASILFGYNNYWQISQNASYFTRINNTSPFLHIWSLAIEMQFYLIWPLLFLLYNFIR